ncbi:MAG: cupin domain-containing protein [Actinomycetota bacterium]|nr:cupin domain-containing protein [Actinomycetota bacterium]
MSIASPATPFTTTAVGQPSGKEVVVVRPQAEIMGRQSLPFFVGVSQASTGARGISMNVVVIPPSGAAEPHSHRGYETAIYVLKGKIRVRHGRGLADTTFIEAGDFMFMPAYMPHQPVNVSDTEPAMAIVARNDANEQENVEVFHHVH